MKLLRRRRGYLGHEGRRRADDHPDPLAVGWLRQDLENVTREEVAGAAPGALQGEGDMVGAHHREDLVTRGAGQHGAHLARGVSSVTASPGPRASIRPGRRLSPSSVA